MKSRNTFVKCLRIDDTGIYASGNRTQVVQTETVTKSVVGLLHSQREETTDVNISEPTYLKHLIDHNMLTSVTHHTIERNTLNIYHLAVFTINVYMSVIN